MRIIPETSYEEFENSNVFPCFIAAKEEDGFYVKVHADAPNRPSHMIGSVGDIHGRPELFHLLLPAPLAIGDRGTIINLSTAAIVLPYPTFVPKRRNIDGYNVISGCYGAPSTRVARLMALAFLPKPADATEVDHLDGNPAHDELSNLEWVSHGENLRRGRHSTHQPWSPEDYVLMIQDGSDPMVVHPSKVSAITKSRNSTHILRRHTRKSANGWYVLLNPSRSEALMFVERLPFQDTAYYTLAVGDLFESLDID